MMHIKLMPISRRSAISGQGYFRGDGHKTPICIVNKLIINRKAKVSP